MDGLLGGDGSLDLGALEEWGNQLDELSKDCDTEKLSSMAEACGNSMEAAMKTCTDECKAMFAFMGESGGCGDLYVEFCTRAGAFIPFLTHRVVSSFFFAGMMPSAWEILRRSAMGAPLRIFWRPLRCRA